MDLETFFDPDECFLKIFKDGHLQILTIFFISIIQLRA